MLRSPTHRLAGAADATLQVAPNDAARDGGADGRSVRRRWSAGALLQPFSRAVHLSREHRHFALPVLNAFAGDKLARWRPQMAISMSFRRGGDDISMAELDIGNRATAPGRTVVVMVHGFCADEVPFIRMAPGEPGYGARLAEELGVSVVYVRYNTGLHISDNGEALSRLLDAMVTRYADDIDQVVLVGHSMGGLVCRSAGHYGHRQSAAWLRKHTVQVLIGVPMMGSYLEQGANIASLVLRRIPNLHTRLLGRLLDGRSVGTKDLRTGSMRHEDWHGALPGDTGLDADLATLLARRHPVALLDGVDYHIVVGTLAGEEAHPLSFFLGDGLITGKSASGKGLFAPDDPVTTRGSLTVISNVSHPQTLFSQTIGSHVVGVVGRYVPSSG